MPNEEEIFCLYFFLMVMIFITVETLGASRAIFSY